MLQTTNHGASPLPNPVDASLAKPVPAAESGSRVLGLGTARLGAAERQEVAQPVMPMRLSEAPVGATAPAAAPSAAAAAESVAHSQLLTAMIQTLQQQGVPATLPQPEPEPEPKPQPRPRASEQGLWLTGHVREQQRRSREGQAETVEEAIELSNLNADADT
eukprot:COSAG04_NODE_141_length_23595_cov_4.393003_13_plen_162_part_00